MIWHLLMVVLAAVGLLSVMWMILGMFLSGGRGGCVVCICRPDGKEAAFVARVKLLREFGFLRCPVLLVDEGIGDHTRSIAQGTDEIVICGPGEIPGLLELERNEIG